MPLVLLGGCKKEKVQVDRAPVVAISVVEQEVGEQWFSFDISRAGNSDYHHDPFVIRQARQKEPPLLTDHYPALKSGINVWRSIPFYMAVPYEEQGSWPLINSGEQPGLISLAFEPVQLNTIFFAVSAGYIKGRDKLNICDLVLKYSDGTVSGIRAVSGVNTFEYWQDYKLVAADYLLYDGATTGCSDQLSLLAVDLDDDKELAGIDIFDNPANDAVLVIFSLSGLKAGYPSPVTLF
jgi:hypothetical protein